MRKTIITLIVLCVLLVGCGNASSGTSKSAANNKNDFVGAYVGNLGSYLVLHSDKSADYYYLGFDKNHADSWKVKDNELIIKNEEGKSIKSDKIKKDSNIVNFPNQDGWDEEYFEHVNNSNKVLTPEDYLKLRNKCFKLTNSNKEQKNGFDKSTNNTYSAGNASFEVPGYFGGGEKSDDGDGLNFSVDDGSPFCYFWVNSNKQKNCKGLKESDYYDLLIGDVNSFSSDEVKLVDYHVDVNKKRVSFEFVLTSHQKDGSIYKFNCKGYTLVDEKYNEINNVVLFEAKDSQLSYFDDFDKIVESYSISKKKKDDNKKDNKVKEEDSSSSEAYDDDAVFYSTNNEENAKKGDRGVFSYMKSGESYNIFYIIDFDEGYVYRFIDGNGDDSCERVKIKSGTLNDTLTITYHDSGTEWSNYLHFKYVNSPDRLIVVDDDGFQDEYKPVDLDDALSIMDSLSIVDY